MASPMRADIQTTLANYDISDHATLRTILQAKLGTEIDDSKDNQAALATIKALREAQDKPDERLITDMIAQSFLEARVAVKTAPGACPQGFAGIYAHHLQPLPWNIVGTREKEQKSFAQLARPAFLIGLVAPDIQPALDASHALSNGPAWRLLGARVNLATLVPCRDQAVAALAAYIAAHDIAKPDIWSERAITLPASLPLTPVAVAIWDSGFDRSLFPGQLLLAPDGTPIVGPAFDVLSRPTSGELAPLTPDDKAAYPTAVADQNGVSDLQTGIDSKPADIVRAKFAAMSPAQAQLFMTLNEKFTSYMHGTHVAGIAALGNPAIRLTSTRSTFDTKPVPTPATDDLQQHLAASDITTVAWFRAHHIRVVNMSWWNRPSNYEDDLEKNGIGKTADDRKKLARHYFNIERDALYKALKSAPEILFITIAGNNDSDNAFEETIPSSFSLPNLLVVGAVDQAGDQTSFTSTGQNIGVYANGYHVQSVVPGGARVSMSGTSMAAPAATNLAAKLIAIKPDLTPVETIKLIEKTADTGASGNIARINPRRAIAALGVSADR